MRLDNSRRDPRVTVSGWLAMRRSDGRKRNMWMHIHGIPLPAADRSGVPFDGG